MNADVILAKRYQADWQATHQPPDIGGHAPPWTFSQALACIHGGGRVRRQSDPDGFFIHLVDGELVTSSGWRWEPTQEAILACNWTGPGQ